MPATRLPAARRKRAEPGPQSLLVVHVDSDRLRQDGLHLGAEATWAASLSALALGADVAVRDTRSVSELRRTVDAFVASGKRVDVLVVIGHSNAAGIRIADDHLASWKEFAAYIKPLKPRRLLLVACRAGRWDAGEKLFSALRDLRRIFACPVNASKDFGKLMLFAVPYVVANRRPRDKDVRMSQLASVAMTGRQLREWRRTDRANPDSALFDVLADVVDPLAREVPQALMNTIGSIFGRRA